MYENINRFFYLCIKIMRTANIHIHHENIIHNIHRLKSLAPNSRLLAMVKANAYGHGVEHVVPAMYQADGFGVACLSEALAVRHILKADDCRPIVIMQGAFSNAEWERVIKQDFSCMIHTDEQVKFALRHQPDDLMNAGQIWLKYNTGMNRLGLSDEVIVSAAKKLLDKNYRIILTSHFACADEKDNLMNMLQIDKFKTVYQLLKNEYGDKIQGSLCNSAGIVNFQEVHYDWVRSGIAVYGSSPVADKTASELALKPAMSLTAKIMAIHYLKNGELLGYGATWQANRDSMIGIVSLGYGDGYPRVVHNAKVLINHVFCPIIGRVAMDMIAVDLTDLTALNDKWAQVGEVVLFWGEQDGQVLSIDEVAKSAGTIGYELMCRLTTRADRVVIGSNK